MKKNRPVNLALRTLKFPPMAIASILHRFSGILILLFVPFLLYLLTSSLEAETSFRHLQKILAQLWAKILIWAFLTALIYHLFAGLRHMIMDLGWGESLRVARRSALVVIGLAVIASIGLGIWLW